LSSIDKESSRVALQTQTDMAATGTRLRPRRHTCLVCQQCFARSEHLTRHLRRHTSSKPYQCRLCLQCFSRKESHDRHQHKQHFDALELPKPRLVGSLERPSGEILRAQLANFTSISTEIVVENDPLDRDLQLSAPEVPAPDIIFSDVSTTDNDTQAVESLLSPASLPSQSTFSTLDPPQFLRPGTDHVFGAATFIDLLPPASPYQLFVIGQMRNLMIESLQRCRL